MWESIQYVTTGLTLVTFGIAVAAWVYKSKSEAKERLIKSAPELYRADLVRRTLEFFDIEADALTKEQRFRLALEQINARKERFKTTSVVVCIIALILASISAYAIHKSASTFPDNIKPAPGPAPSAPSAP